MLSDKELADINTRQIAADSVPWLIPRGASLPMPEIVTLVTRDVPRLLATVRRVQQTYAVAITVHGPEPHAQIHTYVRLVAADSAFDALARADAWVKAKYADDVAPASWRYKFAVSGPVATLLNESPDALSAPVESPGAATDP
jgi:hypothetical protein